MITEDAQAEDGHGEQVAAVVAIASAEPRDGLVSVLCSTYQLLSAYEVKRASPERAAMFQKSGFWRCVRE